MTPDEGLQHQWILEGNFNKVRPRPRPTVKKATDGSTNTENTNENSNKKQNSNKPGGFCFSKSKYRCFIRLAFNLTFLFSLTVEKVSSDANANDKIKQDSLTTGAKMAPAERLRPIGASAEEDVCERNASNKQQEGERPVHIIIKPQEEVGTERNDSEEPAQCLPPIM